MKIDLTRPKSSSFESTEADLKNTMFKILSNDNILKLLKYNTPDALLKPNLTPEERKALINTNIRVVPKLPILPEAGSYIIIIFDTFLPNSSNQLYRDNIITFDIICDTDSWVMDDYMLRPYKIMHELDSMFNNSKLNGIGKVQFVSADILMITDELAGYTLRYKVINDV